MLQKINERVFGPILAQNFLSILFKISTLLFILKFKFSVTQTP